MDGQLNGHRRFSNAWGNMMHGAKELLTEEDYRIYRGVRAVSILFIFIGSLVALSGIMTMLVSPPQGQKPIPIVVSIIASVIGLAGLVGGIATLVGHPIWARFAYVMAAFYILAFPVGTILSYVMIKGLDRYLKSKKFLREAKVERLPLNQ